MNRSAAEADRNQEATVYMGNLDERCTDALVWELMLQAGPVVNVHLPKDRVSMSHQGYGFCEFLTEDDAEYACKIMNQIKLFGKPIRVNKASSDRKQIDIGANLYIGGLDANVDERMLYDTFTAFGTLVQTAKIQRDLNTGQSMGYGFISYDSFESADQAIESMHGQHLMNKAIDVQYAFKKDGKGERHGTPAERLLAAQARKNNALPGGMGMGMPPPPPPMRFPAGPPPGMIPPPQGMMPGPPPGMAMPGPPPGSLPPPPQGFAPPTSLPPPPMGFAPPMQGGFPPAPPPGFSPRPGPPTTQNGMHLPPPPPLPPHMMPPGPHGPGSGSPLPPPPPGFGMGPPPGMPPPPPGFR